MFVSSSTTTHFLSAIIVANFHEQTVSKFNATWHNQLHNRYGSLNRLESSLKLLITINYWILMKKTATLLPLTWDSNEQTKCIQTHVWWLNWKKNEKQKPDWNRWNICPDLAQSSPSAFWNGLWTETHTLRTSKRKKLKYSILRDSLHQKCYSLTLIYPTM